MSVKGRIAHIAVRRLARVDIPVDIERALISFTFDDFPKSAAVAGAEIIESAGLRATFYASAGNMGGTFDGIPQYDRDDLARLSARGHEIGCHSATHPRMTRIDAELIEEEYRANRQLLGRAGDPSSLRTHAYPYGDVSPRLKRIAAGHFQASRGIDPGLNHGRLDAALLKCVCLEPHILARRSARAWVDLAIRRKAWLIFATHDVDARHSRWGIDPDQLAGIVDYAAGSGADVLPVVEALDKIKGARQRAARSTRGAAFGMARDAARGFTGNAVPAAGPLPLISPRR